MKQFALLLVALLLWADPAAAGPVGPAIAAVSTFLKSATIAAAIARSVIGYGLSALSRALMKKREQAGGGITKDETTQGEEVPFSFILGRYATEGHVNCPPMTYETDNDPNEWLVYVIELSDLPISGYGRVWIDGEETTFKTDPRLNLSQNTLGATFNGKHDNYVWARLYDGRQTVVDPYLLSTFANYPERPWTSDMALRGVAYIILTFKGRTKDEIFTNGFPTFRMEVDGVPLLDPRVNRTRLTHNPMVMVWNIYRGLTLSTGDVWGYQVPAADIVSGPAYAAMNACDEQLNPGEPRYRAGLEVTVDMEPSDVVQFLLDACSGDVADMGGEIILSAGPPTPAVYYFTDEQVITTSDEDFTPFEGLDQTKNAVHAEYPDPTKGWEVTKAVPLYNLSWEAEDGGRRLIANLGLRAVPYPRQVRRLMREEASDGRRFRNHLVTLPPDAGGIRLLDTVGWNSVANGYTNGYKLFEVRQKTIDPYTSCVTLQLRERDPSDYSPNNFLDSELPTVASPRPVVRPVVGVAGLRVEPVNAGGLPGIGIWWNREINATAIAWNIRLDSAPTVVANTGNIVSLTDGYVVVTQGLLASTRYRVAVRLVLPRSTVSQEITVTTLDLRPFDTPIPPDLIETIEDMEDFMDRVPADLEALETQINSDIALVDGKITTARSDLSLSIDAVRDLAMNNLNVARNYTDTAVRTETVARQTETGALSARLDQISAVAMSSNLLINGDFVDGVTGWSGGVVANSNRGQINNGQRATQAFDAVLTPNEMLQWRVSYDRTGASGGTMNARVRFFNSAGTQLGTDIVTDLPYVGDGMRVASAQHTRPDNTARAEISFYRSGSTVYIDSVAVTKVDQQTVARIQSLELSFINDQLALTNYQNEANSRMSNNEAAIANEASTRSTADQSLATRAASLESITQNHGGRITTTETTLADQSAGLSQLETIVEAESGRTDIVRDGQFALGLLHWSTVTSLSATNRVVQQNTSGAGGVPTIPAKAALRIGTGDTAGSYRGTAWRPVTAEEVIELSANVYWPSGAPRPAVLIRFANSSKTFIPQSTRTLQPAAAAAGWQLLSMKVTVPATAVFAQVYAGVGVAGTGDSLITNAQALRTGAGYASAADASQLAQSLADDKQALSTYRIQANARLDNVETGVSQQASATQTLNSRVGEIEGVNVNQSIALTSLNNSMYGPNGEVRAQAAATNALTSRVSNAEGRISAVSESLTDVNAKADRMYASGRLRISSEATPTGAQSRIGLRAEAGPNDTSHSAAMYLIARSDSTSDVSIVADRFSIANNGAANSAFSVPFIVSGSRVYMQDAIVRTLSIGDQEITIPVNAQGENEIRLSRTAPITLLHAALARRGYRTTITFTSQIAGTGAGAALIRYTLIRQTSDGANTQLGIFFSVTGLRGTRTDSSFRFTDYDTAATPVSYHVQATSPIEGDYEGQGIVYRRTLELEHRLR